VFACFYHTNHQGHEEILLISHSWWLPATCCQLGPDMRASIPDNHYKMLAALQSLIAYWPTTFLYHCCPGCNQLFRCELSDATQCEACKREHPDKPHMYER
jgi:hypothetical protein